MKRMHRMPAALARLSPAVLSPAVLSVAAALAAAPGLAQERFPSQPIRIIVPFAPGGSVDLAGRLIAAEAEPAMGAKVLVENRGGAGTLIGTKAVTQSRPDGYTVLINTSTVLTNALAHREAGYTMKDLATVSGVGVTHCVLITNSQMPIRSIQELVAYSRSNPGKLNVSGVGAGNITNLVWDRFRRTAKLDVQEINFSGGAPAMQALVAGQTQLFFAAPVSVRPGIVAGTARGIAVTGDTRLGVYPDVPTFREQGITNMPSCLWYGAFVPVKTPANVLSVLQAGFAKAMASDSLRNGLLKVGVEPWSKSPAEFDKLLAEDEKVLAADIATSGFKAGE
jgi:tripartite-type tricarboxylate transporter receptor subunit TctC